MIRAYNGRAEYCLKWNIYMKLALIVNFKWIAWKKWTSLLKLVVILSTVSLKLCKEYLNTVTYNTPLLLWMKCWTVWYRDSYSSPYMGVRNFQKRVHFWPTLYMCILSHLWLVKLVTHQLYMCYVGKDTVTSLLPGSGEIVIQDRLIKWVKVSVCHFALYCLVYSVTAVVTDLRVLQK